MNKYQKEFDLLRKLCPLDERERTCLNYGMEQGKIEKGKDIENLLKAITESYPTSKAEYVDFDVFLKDVINKAFENQLSQN